MSEWDEEYLYLVTEEESTPARWMNSRVGITVAYFKRLILNGFG